jgi:DNA helicase-2/ATP-dependent DNA helicase PcrA
VIELDADLEAVPSPTTTDDPYVLGPRFLFEIEELHHLVWSNSIDLRRPDEPRWRLLDDALSAGATPAPPGAECDFVTPAGTGVWLDGGPPRLTLPIDGVPVIPAVAVEHRTFGVPAGNDSTADLAPDQLAAVTHATGSARIIAPAGSGKTRVLTERARHLLNRWNLPGSAVTLVAFNKRAQEEMRARTQDLSGLQVRTLNSIALAIVNGTAPFAPQARHWATIDEREVREIIGELVSFPRRRNSDPIAPWIEALGLVRLGLVDPEEVESRGDGNIDGFADFWPRYRTALEGKGAVDFDDQISRALSVLLTDPAARRAARRACRLLLVDEFQDLTPAHLLLVRLLAAPDGAVFGVGDDDQTIYGYNGADPAWLIEFDQLFPGCGAHPLEVNYRCPAGVVEVVDRLLRHNHRRVDKVMRAASSARPGWTVDDRADVVAATRDAVGAALSAGVQPSEIAVLTRVNSLQAPVQAALIAAGVGVASGVALEFLDRTSVRAILAWLRLASAGSRAAGVALRADDIREALRRPSRSLHPRITDWACEQDDVAGLLRLSSRLNTERDSQRVADFAADVQRLQEMVGDGASTSDAVLTLLDGMGLAGSVATLDSSRRGMNRTSQGDDLTAMRHLAALHDDMATFERWLRDSLAVRRTPDGVVLGTVHRVKGQEWPHVVVHFADAEQYPHRLSEDIEEERRLFHVALTRASSHVTIVVGERPSPFVAELTTEPEAGSEVRLHAAEPARSTSARRPPSADALAAALDAAARDRFEALRELRGRLRDGKPAYVVFDNKTLVAIARDAPTTTTELRNIPGIGPAKLERYGEAVLELIRELTA